MALKNLGHDSLLVTHLYWQDTVTYVRLRDVMEIESQGEIWELLMTSLRGNLVFANRDPLCQVQCPSWHASGAS